MRHPFLPSLALPALLFVGCGGAPMPEAASATSTQAAIRAAQEVGANDVPKAALHLRYAQDQLEQAQALEEDGDEERAAYVLLRAEADAELAIALMRQHEAEQEAEEAEAQAAELQRRDRRNR